MNFITFIGVQQSLQPGFITFPFQTGVCFKGDTAEVFIARLEDLDFVVPVSYLGSLP